MLKWFEKISSGKAALDTLEEGRDHLSRHEAEQRLNAAVAEKLMAASPEQFGDDYHQVFLQQYKDSVASTYTVSGWRNNANQYFLGINTVIVGGLAIGNVDSTLMAVLSSFAGVVICMAWMGAIGSYRTLNRAKFRVINVMEQQMPMAPFEAEYHAYSNDSIKHTRLSAWESFVPGAYIMVHIVVGAANLGFFESLLEWWSKS